MPRTAQRGTDSVQRRDIEGLRAIAVGVVVAGHLLAQPAGGFVGVDIFFVISGFLITGLLLREYERDGRISFREFYARRVRRILPAALLVLLVTCIAARIVFFESRAKQTYEDSIWAALSLANWHLASNGTDYFQSTLPPSIVQHYWSLAVEEQFYFVWPLLIVLIGWFATRRAGVSVRASLTVALSLIVALSFTWALWQTPRNTTVAYFSTFTRGWELGIGGLLAIGATRLKSLPRWASFALVWAGLAAIAYAVVYTRSDASFPAPGALPATLGAVALIAGGCSSRTVLNPLLENPVARFLGQISYSLYLWHWPVIILTETLMVKGSTEQIAVSLAASVALATASFYGIEQPIRRTTFLSRKAPGRPARRLSPRASAGYSAALALGAVALIGVALVPESVKGAEASPVWPSTLPSSSSTGSTGTSPDAPAGDAAAEWTKKIDTAVGATAWPSLSPSLDKLADSRVREWDECGNVNRDQEAGCRYGNASAKKTVVVLGDSIAISWIPAVRAAYEGSGWQVQGLTFGECPAARIDVVSTSQDRGFTEQCRAHQEFALERIETLKPDLVLVSTTDGTLGRVVGSEGAAAATALQLAQVDALEQLSSKGTKVVVLAPPPPRQDLVSCATRFSVPGDCLSDLADSWATLQGVDQAAATEAKVAYIDTKTWTCTANGACPGFIGRTPVMADGVHLTDAMSRQLGPLLVEAVENSKV